MINIEDFSERLQYLFNYYGISAAAFAESINIPRSSISHILSGRNKPSLDFVLKTIDQYKEIDLLWLTKGEGEFPKNTATTSKTTESNIHNTDVDLFNQSTVKEGTEKQTDITEVSLVDKGAVEMVADVKKTPSQKSIEKVLLFYSDGTFLEYSPK